MYKNFNIFISHSSCIKTQEKYIFRGISIYENTQHIYLSLPFQNLLQEVSDVEKDLLQIGTLKDSITASSTAEAQASLSQRIDNLQNHKRALDSSIRENLALLTLNSNQRVQRVEEEVSCVQRALKDLADIFGNLCENREALPDIRELKQKWHTVQVLLKHPTKSYFTPEVQNNKFMDSPVCPNTYLKHTHTLDFVIKWAFIALSGLRYPTDRVGRKSSWPEEDRRVEHHTRNDSCSCHFDRWCSDQTPWQVIYLISHFKTEKSCSSKWFISQMFFFSHDVWIYLT